MILVEKLRCHHHLLLLTPICIWGFSLVHQIEQVSLVRSCRRICCSYPLISNSTRISSETTSSISIATRIFIITVLASIALSELCHEITIEHSLSHLGILLVIALLLTLCIESTYSCLVEHLLLLDVWQHLVDTRIICGLKHDASLCCIHFINRERTLVSCSCVWWASLLAHTICHEECLIWFLSTEPIIVIRLRRFYLHSIHSLGGWLTLSTSVILVILKSIS